MRFDLAVYYFAFHGIKRVYSGGGKLFNKYRDKFRSDTVIVPCSEAHNVAGTVNEFSHRKYFVVSAVGRRDAIIPVQKTVANVEKGSADTFADKPVFNANPYNIENVLLWIMYKTGIIE